MQTFTDARGTVWRVQLDLVAAIRVDDAGITHRGERLLLTDPDKWFFPALMRSPRLQAAVLFQLVRPQAEEAGISETEFQQRLYETVDDGAGGRTTIIALAVMYPLQMELTDFFRSCPTSSRRLLRAQNRALSLLMEANQALVGPEDGQETHRNDELPQSNGDEIPTTPFSVSQPPPESTGEPQG